MVADFGGDDPPCRSGGLGHIPSTTPTPSLMVSAVTETTVAKWVKRLGASGKTLANTHRVGALDAARRRKTLPSSSIGRGVSSACLTVIVQLAANAGPDL
jgi:hypothetical protein